MISAIKFTVISLLFALGTAAAPPLFAEELTAVTPPSWTSIEGKTIQGYFVKLTGEAVVIFKDDRDYTILFTRLASGSVEQAKKLGGTGGSALPQSSPLLQGGMVTAPAGAPAAVQRAITAGNALQKKGYKYGGGRDPLEDTGYDCSGTVSYVLIKAGLLDEPRTSRSFAEYGQPGAGRWITLHVSPGHVFITLCGVRLDTGGRGGVGERGPRWSAFSRGGPGWILRHPPGL